MIVYLAAACSILCANNCYEQDSYVRARDMLRQACLRSGYNFSFIKSGEFFIDCQTANIVTVDKDIGPYKKGVPSKTTNIRRSRFIFSDFGNEVWIRSEETIRVKQVDAGKTTILIKHREGKEPIVGNLMDLASSAVDITRRNIYIPTNPRYAGRIRGDWIELFMLDLFSLPSRQDVSQVSVDLTSRADVASRAISPLILKGDEIALTVEGPFLFNTNDSFKINCYRIHDKKRILLSEYEIVPSMNFVCPSVREYDQDGRLMTEWKSENFLKIDSTDIYHPAKSFLRYYNVHTGELSSSVDISYDISRSQVNQQISKSQFEFKLNPNTQIMDSSPEVNKVWVTPGGEPTVLSLEDDFSKARSMAVFVLPESPVDQPRRRGNLRLVMLAGSITLLASLLALWLVKRRVKAVRTIAIILLGLSAGGCSRADRLSTTPIYAAPAAVDLGDVRPTGGFVPVSFELVNDSDVEQGIAEVKTSCGCMPIPGYPERVAAHSRVTLSTQLRATLDPKTLTSSITVRLAADDTEITIPVRAQCVRDLWTDHQSTVVPVSGGVLKTTFEVYSYENAAAAPTLSCTLPNVDIKVVARRTEGKITTIVYQADSLALPTAYRTELDIRVRDALGAVVATRSLLLVDDAYRYAIDMSNDQPQSVTIVRMRRGETLLMPLMKLKTVGGKAPIVRVLPSEVAAAAPEVSVASDGGCVKLTIPQTVKNGFSEFKLEVTGTAQFAKSVRVLASIVD